MAHDPDAMWKPGYDGPPPTAPPTAPSTAPSTAPATAPSTGGVDPGGPGEIIAGSTRLQPGPSSSEPAAAVDVVQSTRIRRWRRPTALVGAAIIVIVAVSTWRLSVDGDSQVRGEILAADPRRLPTEVEQLWSTSLRGTGTAISSSIVVDGHVRVVVAVDDGSRDRTSIVGLDGRTGEIAWRRSFSFAPPEVRFLGSFDDVVVIEQLDPSRRRLLGLASHDGSDLWESDSGDGGFNVVLPGTSVITEVAPQDILNGESTIIDPSTGERLGRVRGLPATTDLAGRWYFAADRGDEGPIRSVDLRDGWTEPVLEADPGIGPAESLGVVGDRLLAVGVGLNLTELTDPDEEAARTPIDGAPDLPRLESMFPAGGSRFVGVAGGVIVGAELIGDAVARTWQVTASMRNFGITERGILLTIADAGAGFVDGVDIAVIDAFTGERLASGGPVGNDGLPIFVGDGFIRTNLGLLDSEWVGHDLDGVERWRMPVAGRLAVGDRLMATLENTPAGFVVTAFGSPASSAVDEADG